MFRCVDQVEISLKEGVGPKTLPTTPSILSLTPGINYQGSSREC